MTVSVEVGFGRTASEEVGFGRTVSVEVGLGMTVHGGVRRLEDVVNWYMVERKMSITSSDLNKNSYRVNIYPHTNLFDKPTAYFFVP